MAIKFINVNYNSIFENLNIEIKENQITTVIGKNGSGKTSFLNLIFGLDLKFDGKIIVDGNSIHTRIKNKGLKKIREKIFYLNQDYYNQLFNINILDDIKYLSPNLDIDKLEELLKMFCLNTKILNKNYFELTSSEKKKILLISMFIKNSKIILLDDPTSGLDLKSINNLIKLLKKAKRKGKIIIISSQDSEFLLSISDKIIFLKDKKLTQYNNKYEVFDNLSILNETGLSKPTVLQFREEVLKRKKIKLVYRDNINDLIKDIYRNAK